MAEPEHVLAIVVSNGAETGDAHIARDQHAGDYASGWERIFPIGGGLGRVNRASGSALHGRYAELLQHRTELLQHVLIETGEGEWRFNRSEHRRLPHQIGRRSGGDGT